MLKISTKIDWDEVCQAYNFLPQSTVDVGGMAYAGSTLLVYALDGSAKEVAAIYKFPGSGLSEAKKFLNGDYPHAKAIDILDNLDDQLIQWEPGGTPQIEDEGPVDLPVKGEKAPSQPINEPVVVATSIKEKSLKVKLKDAKELLEPVYATSSKSKYHTVGIGGDYNVGARWLGDNLSVRVEPKTPSGDTLFKSENPGLSKGTADDGRPYYSTHVTCNDVATYRKVMGALMGSMTGLASYTLEATVIKGQGL